MGREPRTNHLLLTTNLVVGLLVVMLATPARADDTPRMYQPPAPGEVVGYPNWVLTPDGKEKLDATLNRQLTELVTLRSENSSLKASLVTMESKPALTPLGVAVLIGVGVVIGAGAVVAIHAVAR